MTAEHDLRHPLVQQIAASVLRERLPGIPAELAVPLVAGQLAAKFATMRAEHPGATVVLLPRSDAEPEAVGYLVADRSGDEIRLVDLAVTAPVRGRGIASAALDALAEEADVSGRAITLSVWAGDPAERLYARHGFERADADTAESGYRELRRPPRPTERQSTVCTGDTSTSSSSAQ
ncbi:GNAT family N-acetyltransferase [Agromyces mediolanus]|uniref:GNAT family N-acetyltransferase n=1 Tax=Agromyces mediolanus TaxID=41986 RepID=UPI00203C3B3D|nr:GNAT family N-acetyltransferase [Agromyces mediolanus]MCM3657528.1 GNAT family N-acetyltransferase [Agromyces mediolanus]